MWHLLKRFVHEELPEQSRAEDYAESCSTIVEEEKRDEGSQSERRGEAGCGFSSKTTLE